MLVQDLPADGEAQARAVADLLRRIERIEDASHLLLGNSDPGIAHVHDHVLHPVLPRGAGPKGQRPPRRHRVDRIGHQVVDGLHELVPVDKTGRHFGGGLEYERHLLPPAQVGIGLSGLQENVAEIRVNEVVFHLPGEAQRVLEDPLEPPHFGDDDLRVLLLSCLFRKMPFETTREPPDDRQGVADLVRHVGGDATERGELLRLDQLVLKAPQLLDRLEKFPVQRLDPFLVAPHPSGQKSDGKRDQEQERGAQGKIDPIRERAVERGDAVRHRARGGGIKTAGNPEIERVQCRQQVVADEKAAVESAGMDDQEGDVGKIDNQGGAVKNLFFRGGKEQEEVQDQVVGEEIDRNPEKRPCAFRRHPREEQPAEVPRQGGDPKKEKPDVGDFHPVPDRAPPALEGLCGAHSWCPSPYLPAWIL